MFGDALFGGGLFGGAEDDEDTPPDFLSDPRYLILSDQFSEFIYAAEIYPWALGDRS